MPRSGGVYSKPAGTTAVPNTTITSASFNAVVDDLVTDANAARPIAAGGTGATNANAAMTNLGGVRSTGGTATTLTFAGVTTIQSHTGPGKIEAGPGNGASYGVYNTKLTIHWGLGIASNTGAINGYYDAVTGTWDVKGGYKINGQSLDARYVAKTGDTMTGELLISKAADPTLKIANATYSWQMWLSNDSVLHLRHGDAPFEDNFKVDTAGNSYTRANVYAGPTAYLSTGDVSGPMWSGLLSNYINAIGTNASNALNQRVAGVRLAGLTEINSVGTWLTDAPNVLVDSIAINVSGTITTYRRYRTLQINIPASGWVNVTVA